LGRSLIKRNEKVKRNINNERGEIWTRRKESLENNVQKLLMGGSWERISL
jgi:hypothetical protein